MVNNKTIAIIIIAMIGAVIAITMLVDIANENVAQTTTLAFSNTTVTAPAVNATLDLTGRDLIAGEAVTNATNHSTGALAGFLFQEGIGSDGLQSVQLRVNDTSAIWAGQSVNVSYTANPDGYATLGSTRSITLLITLIAALAILVWVLTEFWKGDLGELVRNGFRGRK